MIPAKEAKDMLYKMLSENFVSLQVMDVSKRPSCQRGTLRPARDVSKTPAASPAPCSSGGAVLHDEVLLLLSPTGRRFPRLPTTRHPAPSTSTPSMSCLPPGCSCTGATRYIPVTTGDAPGDPPVALLSPPVPESHWHQPGPCRVPTWPPSTPIFASRGGIQAPKGAPAPGPVSLHHYHHHHHAWFSSSTTTMRSSPPPQPHVVLHHHHRM